MLTASVGACIVWNSRSGAALRTLDLGAGVAALSVAFGPGTRHAIVGCKDGSLKMFDLASGDCTDEGTGAHDGPVWALATLANGRGIATGSSDKEVKFWDFDNTTAGDLKLVHVRTLRVGDEVLALRFSSHADPARVLLAVALLDATVKVFYNDTLRFALSLYGHTLPVLSMDISADGTLLATGSADKTLKVWGLDFGDLHKSFHAGSGAVTAVGFVANTHYVFTGGRDRSLRYWDVDRFARIYSVESAHSADVWAIAASPDGTFVATSGADRALRIWRRTQEQVFIDEEREKELSGALVRVHAPPSHIHSSPVCIETITFSPLSPRPPLFFSGSCVP